MLLNSENAQNNKVLESICWFIVYIVHKVSLLSIIITFFIMLSRNGSAIYVEFAQHMYVLFHCSLQSAMAQG